MLPPSAFSANVADEAVVLLLAMFERSGWTPETPPDEVFCVGPVADLAAMLGIHPSVVDASLVDLRRAGYALAGKRHGILGWWLTIPSATEVQP